MAAGVDGMAMTGMKGKQRSFWRGLLLTIVTLGIYGIYWHFKVFDELSKQWKKGDVAVVWLILSIVLPIIPYIVYMSKSLDLLHQTRQGLGLAAAPTKGTFFSMYFLGIITLGITTMVGFAKLQGAINECWASAKPAPRPAAPAAAAMRA